MKALLLLLLTYASSAYSASKLEVFGPNDAPTTIEGVAVHFTTGWGNAINSSGDVAGILSGTCGGNSCSVAFFWENGSQQPVLASGLNFRQCTRPYAIDNSGRIFCEDFRVAFVSHSAGGSSLTPVLCDAEPIHARPISLDKGLITMETLGTKIRTSDHKSFVYDQPVSFKLKGDVNGCSMSRIHDIPASSGEFTSAWVASMHGRAVGWTLDIPADYDMHGQDPSNYLAPAAVWPGSKKMPELLPPIASGNGPRALSPRGVNKKGLVVGRTFAWPTWWDVHTTQAFVATKRFGGYDMKLLPTPCGDPSYDGYGAVAVNNSGTIIGGFHGGGRAGIWEKKRGVWIAQYLESLVNPGDLKTLCSGSLGFQEALAINDHGQITGGAICSGTDGTAEFRVYRLTR
jgi:hypothetical protein